MPRTHDARVQLAAIRRAGPKIVVASAAAALAAIAALTWWALEAGGVAVLETRAPDGSIRSTHVWFAEPNGELWLEAGTPENAWYLDILREPRVSFLAPGRSGEYIAQGIEDPGAHGEIRSLLREKYGLRDWWIGVLFDTSRSRAVRLTPVPGRAREQARPDTHLEVVIARSGRAAGRARPRRRRRHSHPRSRGSRSRTRITSGALH